MSPSNLDGPVVIAGAGLGGLVLALALRQQGIEVQVYERASELAEVGAGITLWGNAIQVLRCVGAEEQVRAISQPTPGGVIALANGTRLVDMASTLTSRAILPELWGIHRAELQRALYELLPAGCVHFGAAVQRYEHRSQGVTVHVAGRTPIAAALLVGADGLHSAVRTQMLGVTRPRYAGYVCWRGVCPVPKDWSGVPGEFWGRGDRFGVVRLAGERLYWFAVATASEGTASPPGEAGKTELLARFAHYHFDVPQVIANTAADAIIYREISDRPPVKGWSDGAITLLGDAIHPTTPNMGQGAAMALESAIVLSRALTEKPTLAAALKSYEHTRWRRTKQITETSLMVGKMAHWESAIARWFRNMLFRHLPQSIRNRQLSALTTYSSPSIPLLD